MKYYLTFDHDWKHAQEFQVRGEAERAWRIALDAGKVKVASVYSAPRRAVFNEHMSHQCQLVCAGVALCGGGGGGGGGAADPG